MASTTQVPLEERWLQELDAELATLEESRARYDRLKDLRDRLTGETKKPAVRAMNGPGRPRGSKSRKGGRLEQFIDMVTANPGITIPEAASAMDTQPNYLYRIRERAVDEGRITVEGAKLFPVEGSAVPDEEPVTV